MKRSGLQPNTYKGSYEGVFDNTVTGTCSGTGTLPISFDVTANKEKFGDNDELAFSVKVSQRRTITVSCGGQSMASDEPFTYTQTFTLPAEDGAHWNDGLTTYTLRKQGQ